MLKKLMTLGFVLSLTLVLGACNGTITSVQIPADSPWEEFVTVFRSPHDDLVPVTQGDGIEILDYALFESVLVCEDADGDLYLTDNPTCFPGDLARSDLQYQYGIAVGLDRDTFTAGSVQLVRDSDGTIVSGISFGLSGDGGLNVSAGVSDGLLPGAQNLSEYAELALFDEWAYLGMYPEWSEFGPGFVCADGSTDCTSDDDLAAICDVEAEAPDDLAFRTLLPLGAYNLTCGNIPVSINFYNSVGECIRELKAQNCSDLRGRDRATCNHAQIGVCHAAFNVPSSHNPNN
jgi:hypothetical protein